MKKNFSIRLFPRYYEHEMNNEASKYNDHYDHFPATPFGNLLYIYISAIYNLFSFNPVKGFSLTHLKIFRYPIERRTWLLGVTSSLPGNTVGNKTIPLHRSPV